MSQQAEDILQMIVERAVEAEKIPVPAIWRSRIVDLCVRVVHKLITADAAVVRIAIEATKPQASPSAHKHHEVICAWVNGAAIQGQSPSTDEWIDVPPVTQLADRNYLEPSPIHPEYDWWTNWRVKP